MTVANFVGLAEGTIANAALDPGRPYFDGTVYHRVVPGHVIQTGVPKSEKARGPGYSFPNEIHAKLSHNHAGALNMANAGPHTNGSQFCIMLGDRGYLDGNYTVFGETVEGLDVVTKIAQGDTIESVRILRVGAKAAAFRPTTESFQAQIRAAEQRVAEHAEKKRLAEEAWIASNAPPINGPTDAGQYVSGGHPPLRVRYRGRAVRYLGDVIGRQGPPLEVTTFGSSETGAPGFFDPPQVFTVEPGKTKINPGLDAILATMQPAQRLVVVVPAERGYGRPGLTAPEVPGQRRFVISPHTLLAYEIEAMPVSP
jgi:cyclophilin family peptidyl-prolyl cis-trans isomerase